ncbi:fatty acid desaturase family protein [Aestuariivirga litoralis]|uniref:fatty acid desaturase family protein n=1 Tax=Aestuariivirga litoralis TaxID=2650924 RepID=UPI0018C58FA4|nr:fatty acid desaturase family protein [Aestuariivirga litoralis]MBG1232356.1 fatty acid desaturase [Aestuariivirga litoralis]
MTISAAAYKKRDYSLTGEENRRAVQLGLASADWYHSEIPRATMKELMQRKDGPAIRDTIIWFALLLISAAGGIYFWGSWWAVPFFLVYGVMYGSVCDSRWHEAGHGTAFRTRWMNDVVYHIASFMVMRNPTSWRWSHARHHSDTIIVGRDPEIGFMQPPDIIMGVLHFIGIPDIYYHFKIIFKNALGIVTADEQDYIPENERKKAIMWARIHVAIYAAAIIWAVATWSILPLMLIGLPRIYGTWHMVLTGLMQHAGLAEDVLDHRLNSRTVYINPISRWIYWNMNYHVEHHMFPMVPYHALPRLHALIKNDLPTPNSSMWNAYVEMARGLLRQRKEPGYYIRRELPPGARPYKDGFHNVSIEQGEIAAE